MNAVIALCHFCEAHGPCALFCTQTLRDAKLENLQLDELPIGNKTCSACNSIGQASAIYSKDTECQATFISTQTGVLPEVAALVKQAAVRSLSCEINCNKDGGFVFFGDTARGHVISHTFHVNDLQARGFCQLFSIIILMKDKYFLLNTKPFLSEHMRKISVEIQGWAQIVRANEEAQNSSIGRRRSSNGQMGKTPRSLIELTGEENIFAYLHAHFTWILLAGTRVLTEHVTFGNLPWLPTQQHSYSSPLILQLQPAQDPEQEQFFSLRHIKHVALEEFAAVCFCALTGIKVNAT